MISSIEFGVDWDTTANLRRLELRFVPFLLDQNGSYVIYSWLVVNFRTELRLDTRKVT